MKAKKEDCIKKIKNLDTKIETLLKAMETSTENCFLAYKKRIEAEGRLRVNPIFISSSGKVSHLNNITVCDSEKKLNEKIKAGGGINNFKQTGAGVIEFHHKRNTRGNNASIEATLGAAIHCMRSAERDLEKNDFASFLHLLLSAYEAYGSSYGRFYNSKSSRQIKADEKKEIIDEREKLKQQNPSLTKTDATRKALSNLGHSKSKLSRLRRI